MATTEPVADLPTQSPVPAAPAGLVFAPAWQQSGKLAVECRGAIIQRLQKTPAMLSVNVSIIRHMSELCRAV